jgi:hypothetical protein
MGARFSTVHAFGDLVHIDADTSLTATITAFLWRVDGPLQVEVAYLHNGNSNRAWIEDNRLTRADPLSPPNRAHA